MEDLDEDDNMKDKKQLVQKKFGVSIRKQTLIKLQMCTKLKCIHGMVFLRAMLKRIELEKAEFVDLVEEGDQVFIPKDLSQDNLPQSFRYYDPILAIV